MTPKTGRPRGRPKGATNKQKKVRIARAQVAAAAIEAVIPNVFTGNGHAFLMAVYKNPANELAVRVDCAKAALPYESQRLAPAEPQRIADDHVPLADRLKEYAREDAIEASSGKVVELKKKNGSANGQGKPSL